MCSLAICWCIAKALSKREAACQRRHLLVQLPGIGQPVQNEVHAAGHDVGLLRLCGVRAFQVTHEVCALRLCLAVGCLCGLVLSLLGICCASLQEQYWGGVSFLHFNQVAILLSLSQSADEKAVLGRLH